MSESGTSSPRFMGPARSASSASARTGTVRRASIFRFEEYELVRAQSDRFLVAPGHVFPEIERVVESHEHFEIVDKDDEVEAIAGARDPRALRLQ